MVNGESARLVNIKHKTIKQLHLSITPILLWQNKFSPYSDHAFCFIVNVFKQKFKYYFLNTTFFDLTMFSIFNNLKKKINLPVENPIQSSSDLNRHADK